ncbi:TetR/AcrR family transcriptional regulator [Microlunatus parietis]|uniref:AcrR family transcriptional regulator n=1 Tax=Microlunatus parietis TaxID=682979 RepID=A0A7Y9LD29_9ACTN|nr:TetR/AcrR family transcriptional regulator [Microlunatus parietis]NYE72315.1 AcrR family transcriptional regulator [Microlunatus parietis]
MGSDSEQPEEKPESFIRSNRRRQILEGAIATLAAVGFAGASLARIAKDLSISKGVISYHFESKDDLMIKVVEYGYQAMVEAVLPQILEQKTVADSLRTHIPELARYALDHRPTLLAIGEVMGHLRRPDGRLHYGAEGNEIFYEGLEQMYRSGQESGELRDFDVRVMAITQQASIDAMFAYWANHPEHDLVAHAEQLADLFIHAIRREPTPRATRRKS